MSSVLLGTAKPAYPGLRECGEACNVHHRRAHRLSLLRIPRGGLIVLNVGEVVRYVVLWAFSRRQHLAFGRDDLALTILFLIGRRRHSRAFLHLFGFTGDLTTLFPVLQAEFWAQ